MKMRRSKAAQKRATEQTSCLRANSWLVGSAGSLACPVAPTIIFSQFNN
jgi:hypothetical protein